VTPEKIQPPAAVVEREDIYRNPKVLEQRVTLPGYQVQLRELPVGGQLRVEDQLGGRLAGMLLPKSYELENLAGLKGGAWKSRLGFVGTCRMAAFAFNIGMVGLSLAEGAAVFLRCEAGATRMRAFFRFRHKWSPSVFDG
jgi:hypothetical protein